MAGSSSAAAAAAAAAADDFARQLETVNNGLFPLGVDTPVRRKGWSCALLRRYSARMEPYLLLLVTSEQFCLMSKLGEDALTQHREETNLSGTTWEQYFQLLKKACRPEHVDFDVDLDDGEAVKEEEFVTMTVTYPIQESIQIRGQFELKSKPVQRVYPIMAEALLRASKVCFSATSQEVEVATLTAQLQQVREELAQKRQQVASLQRDAQRAANAAAVGGGGADGAAAVRSRRPRRKPASRSLVNPRRRKRTKQQLQYVESIDDIE